MSNRELAAALKDALTVSRERGWCEAMARMATGGEHEEETKAMLEEAEERDRAARQALAEQLVARGFRP